MKLFKIEKYNNKFVIYLLGIKITHNYKKKYDPITHCCYIPELDKLIRQGTIFPHPYGIVISECATIGMNCIIYQNVTIGTDKFEHGGIKEFYPQIGSNVTIYANSLIGGGVKVGDGAVIGAGSIVLNDVPPKTVVAGAPAKVIKYIKD